MSNKRPAEKVAAAKRAAAGRKRGAGKVRIIGGQWRGRVVPVVDLPGLRPSGDRTRETLFNWLQPVLAGSRCLDLFAGSGVLGLEAASRGAAHVLLVEHDAAAVAQLRRNVAVLDAADRVDVLQADACAWLRAGGGRQGWDVVFVDPPWSSGLYAQVLALLGAENGLKKGALVYVEYARGESLECPPGLVLQRDKPFGQARVFLFEKNS